MNKFLTILGVGILMGVAASADDTKIYDALVDIAPKDVSRGEGAQILEKSVGGLTCTKVTPVIPNPKSEVVCKLARKVDAKKIFESLKGEPTGRSESGGGNATKSEHSQSVHYGRLTCEVTKSYKVVKDGKNSKSSDQVTTEEEKGKDSLEDQLASRPSDDRFKYKDKLVGKPRYRCSLDSNGEMMPQQPQVPQSNTSKEKKLPPGPAGENKEGGKPDKSEQL